MAFWSEQYTHKVLHNIPSITVYVVQRAFLKTVLLKSLLFGVKDSSKVVHGLYMRR